MQILQNTNYNFIRWRWHAIAFSAIIIIAGLVQIGMKGLPLGIDFSGGTLLVVKFEQAVSEGAVRAAIESIPGDKVIQPYGDPDDRSWLIRLPQAGAAEQGASLEQGAQTVIDALQKATGSANQCFERGDYAGYLKTFAVLKTPVDLFFDKVMVMAEEKALRENRLGLLAELRKAMNRVADISKLAV